MPALVLFKRRWKLASDDLVIPAAALSAFHFAWTAVLSYSLAASYQSSKGSTHWVSPLRGFVVGLVVIFPASALLEVAIAVVSSRGGPLRTAVRSGVPVLLYTRLGLLAVELFWEILGIVWMLLSKEGRPKAAILALLGGLLLLNWLVTFLAVSLFGKAPPMRDNLGRSLPRSDGLGRASDGSGLYCSINEATLTGSLTTADEEAPLTERSHQGSHEVCCLAIPRKRHSFGQLEEVASFMLGDLDLVWSDVTASLVLLKRSQRAAQEATIAEPSNEIYQFLSGTPITTTTRFLGFKSQGSVEFYSRIVGFMRYPLAAHGLTGARTFKRFETLRRSPARKKYRKGESVRCADVEKELSSLIGRKQFELLSCRLLDAELDGLSFFVGLDHEFRSIVVCLWGTVCLKDTMTKMCSIRATSQRGLVRSGWFASEYFALLAEKIHSILRDDDLLIAALDHDRSSSTESYEVVVTGQSLAGGVACVLAILLRQSHRNLHCFAYGPPNSVLGAACMRETQSFITTVVVGKDMVPRLSCNSIESFRQNVISSLKSCDTPKLEVLCGHRAPSCCAIGREGTTRSSRTSPSSSPRAAGHLGRGADLFDTSSGGLHLPGRVVHIVRSRPKTSCSRRLSQCKRHSVFQAVWARNEDFDALLVSRKMAADHCPLLIMDALEKVLTHISPAKPVRKGAGGRRQQAKGLRGLTATSVNSSHNETTLTSQNTFSDFSTSEHHQPTMDSTYVVATLTPAVESAPPPPPPDIRCSSQSNVGNFVVGESRRSSGAGSYERVGNQTFPKVKLRSNRPSEFMNRALAIAPLRMDENVYNTIGSTPNHLDPGTNTSSSNNNRSATDRLFSRNHGDAAKRHPVLIDNWTGAFAPLASPEALSESSSLASCGESSSTGHQAGFSVGFPGHRGDSIKRLSSGAAYQRLVARIDPIRQSPLGPVRPFSGEGEESEKAEKTEAGQKLSLICRSSSSWRSRSTNREQGPSVGGEGGSVIGDDPRGIGENEDRESYYAEIGEPTSGPEPDGSSDPLLEALQEPEPDLMVFSPPSSGEHSRTRQQALNRFDCEPIYSKVVPRLERKSENSGTPSPAAERRGSVGTAGSTETPRFATPGIDQSPDDDDDYEEAQEQLIYDLVVGHYSCAGRGYPHGFPRPCSGSAFDVPVRLLTAEEVTNPPTDIF